jgi:hypothetical protein
MLIAMPKTGCDVGGTPRRAVVLQVSILTRPEDRVRLALMIMFLRISGFQPCLASDLLCTQPAVKPTILGVVKLAKAA